MPRVSERYQVILRPIKYIFLKYFVLVYIDSTYTVPSRADFISSLRYGERAGARIVSQLVKINDVDIRKVLQCLETLPNFIL